MVKPRAIPWYCEMLDMSVEDSHVDYLSWIKRLNFTVSISWNIQPKIRTNQTTRKGWTKGVYLFLQPFPPQCQVSQVSNLIKMTSTGQRQRPLLKSGLQKSWMSCPILTQSEKNITWKKKWMNSSRGWCKILIQSLQFNGAYILFVRSRFLWLIVFVRRLHIISAISNEPLQNISWFSLVAVSGMMITNAKALCPQLHRIPATFSPKSFPEVTPIPYQQRTEAFVVVVSSLKWFRVDGFHWSILHACSKISGQWTFMNFQEHPVQHFALFPCDANWFLQKPSPEATADDNEVVMKEYPGIGILIFKYAHTSDLYESNCLVFQQKQTASPTN